MSISFPDIEQGAPPLRRARPLLGTFVEIGVRGLPPVEAHAAMDAAFQIIARVQSLMSVFDPASDLSRLRNGPPGRWTLVDASTFEVLRFAALLWRMSDGVFDPVAVASRSSEESRVPDMGDLELKDGGLVRCRRSLRVDLGGIAKGYAVDQAIELLAGSGASGAIVNAGGDLRVCGSGAEWVHLRHPSSPSTLLRVTQLENEALACSGRYFASDPQTHLSNPRGSSCWLDEGAVAVRAASCMTADALCKVLAALGPGKSEKLLRHFGATGILINGSGRVWLEERCDVA